MDFVIVDNIDVGICTGNLPETVHQLFFARKERLSAADDVPEPDYFQPAAHAPVSRAQYSRLPTDQPQRHPLDV